MKKNIKEIEKQLKMPNDYDYESNIEVDEHEDDPAELAEELRLDLEYLQARELEESIGLPMELIIEILRMSNMAPEEIAFTDNWK